MVIMDESRLESLQYMEKTAREQAERAKALAAKLGIYEMADYLSRTQIKAVKVDDMTIVRFTPTTLVIKYRGELVYETRGRNPIVFRYHPEWVDVLEEGYKKAVKEKKELKLRQKAREVDELYSSFAPLEGVELPEVEDA